MDHSRRVAKELNRLGRREVRQDGWVNPLTGQGTIKDKSVAAKWRSGSLLQPEFLDWFYVENDLAQTMVTAVIEDALREGYELRARDSDDADPEDTSAKDAQDMCDALGMLDAVQMGATWGRLYGDRSGVLVLARGDQETPIEDSAEVLDLIEVDRRELQPLTWYQDETEPNYGKVETYQYTPVAMTGVTVKPFIVHESRLVLLVGVKAPKRVRNANDGCHLSVLQAPYSIIKKTDLNFDSICAMLGDMSVGVLKLKGLIDAVVAGKSNVIRDRIDLIDAGKSQIKSMVLDADEEDFEYVERSTGSAAKDIIDKTWERLATATYPRMPVSRLIGALGKGLGDSNDGDRTTWYDGVRGYQRWVLKPAMERLVKLITGTDWEVCFPDLEKQDSLEEAQIAQAQANTDKTYVDMGALTPSEVAMVRFGKGHWTPGYDGIDMEAHEAALERELTDLENPPDPMDPVTGKPLNGSQSPESEQQGNPTGESSGSTGASDVGEDGGAGQAEADSEDEPTGAKKPSSQTAE